MMQKIFYIAVYQEILLYIYGIINLHWLYMFRLRAFGHRR